MSKDIITLSNAAEKEIAAMIALEKNSKIIGIRVGVKSGGCSGFKYTIDFAFNIEKYDEVVKHNGLTIIIDPKAQMYLMGTKMDFILGDFNSGFVFINPNEKSKCGCGSSFNV